MLAFSSSLIALWKLSELVFELSHSVKITRYFENNGLLKNVLYIIFSPILFELVLVFILVRCSEQFRASVSP